MSKYDIIADDTTYDNAEEDALLLVDDSEVVGDHLIDVPSTMERSARGMMFEEALEIVGAGKAQKILCMLCGWANAADAVEMLGISFIITTLAECDLDLTAGRKGMVTAGLFIGMMIGGWLWGSLADKHGRKLTLIMALLFNTMFGAASAFATSYHAFLFFRIMSGLGVGGSIPIVFTYMTEFLPVKKRGVYLSTVAAFWMVGSIIVAFLAWVVIGSHECSHANISDDIELRCETWFETSCGRIPTSSGSSIPAWRLFVLLCATPSFIAAVSLVFASESPKWLATQGKLLESEAILKAMAKRNGRGSFAYNLILSSSNVLSGRENRKVLQGEGISVTMMRVWISLKHILRATRNLFQGTLLRPTLILSAVWFMLSMGFYGLTLWLPNYYQHGGIDANTSVYKVSFFVALANLPGNVFAFWAVDKLGRRMTLVVSMLVSALSVFSIFGIHTTIGTTIFSCFFSAVSVAGWNALNILSTEKFPTAQRAAAFGFLAAIGRIGAILGNVGFGEMSGASPTLPLLLAGCALCIGALLSLLVAETKHTNIG
eukprot:m.46796 g.46796  ORF g.46796 m.46796 type:complete len:545 (+) comp7288_c0_seq1:224-1858(+)